VQSISIEIILLASDNQIDSNTHKQNSQAYPAQRATQAVLLLLPIAAD